MPYQVSVEKALENARRLMKETHCQAVKLEGGKSVCPQIKAMVDAGIPVCAHLGLTPQHINAFGGFKNLVFVYLFKLFDVVIITRTR